MFCIKCGREIEPGAKYCVKCGAPVYKPKQEGAGNAAESVIRDVKSEHKGMRIPVIGIVISLLVLIIIAVAAMQRKDDSGNFAEDVKRVEENTDNSEEYEQTLEAGEESEETDIQVAAEEPVVDVNEAVAEPEEIIYDSQAVSEALEAYRDYMNEISGGGWHEYALLHIDADGIPELFYDSGTTAEGTLLLSYDGQKVCENWLPVGMFRYQEYRNLVYLSSGRMDIYADEIFHLESGELVADVSGWFGLEDNTRIMDEDGNMIPYEYYWEEVHMTEEEYYQKVEDYFDSSMATEYATFESIDRAYEYYVSGIPQLQELVGQVGMAEDILPTSSEEYLSEEALWGLTQEELRLARNEIYARHGYIFKDEGLQAYFNSKSWYQPVTTEVSDTELNEYEIANRDLIKEREEIYNY